MSEDHRDPWGEAAGLEGVGSAAAAARDGIDALLRDRGLRRTDPAMTAESLLRGACASAALDGSASGPEDVRRGDLDEVAAGAVLVATELLSLVPVLVRTPLQAFARLHALAAPAGSDPALRGRPRSEAAAHRLTAIARLLTTPTRAPALVVAALVHAELVTVAPFSSANGVVARAAERLLLVTRGVDPTSLTVPEAGHLRLQREYESNLRAYAFAGAPGPRPGGEVPGAPPSLRAGTRAWLLYAAEAYTAGAQASPLVTPPPARGS